MTKQPGPSIRRRQLGAMLRQLRTDAGKSRNDAAEWLEITDPTMSKLELGKQTVKGPTVRMLCQLYDVDAGTRDHLLRFASEANQRGWWTAYRDTLPGWARQLVSLESDASDVWNYEAEFVPGFLQTPSYVEAITRAAYPDATDEQISRRQQLRRERQTRLDDDNPPQLHLYLNEAVIRRRAGTAAVMREQLDYLAEASQRENMSLRIVPFTAGPHPAMTGSFVLMQFPDEDGPAFAYVENERGGLYQEDPGDLDRYTVVVRLLDETALSEEDSRALIKRAYQDSASD